MEPQTAITPAPEDVLTALKAVIIAWDAGRPIEFHAAMRTARRLLGFKKHGGDGE